MYLFCSNMQGVILNIRKTKRNSGMFVICPPDLVYGIDNWQARHRGGPSLQKNWRQCDSAIVPRENFRQLTRFGLVFESDDNGY